MILPMNQPFTIFLCSLLFGVTTLQAEPTTVNIAAVNNPDMLELKKLSSKFEQKNPDISLRWVKVPPVAVTSVLFRNRHYFLVNDCRPESLSC
jgi:ABC-type glycerol-3-phosphate transport system substrate-binding protein